MAGKINDAMILSAFLSIASQRKHHGKWIPLSYWVNQINKESDFEDVDSRKLLKALNGIKERDLDTTDFDKKLYKGITHIYENNSKIRRRRVSEVRSRKKSHSFLCVETTKTKAFPLPINRDERIEFLQSQYYTYSRNVPCSINTNNNSQFDSTENENESARVVTPTAEIERAAESAAFILDLLGGVINKKYLSRSDLLVDSDAINILKERVLTMGCDLHRQEIDKHYNNDFYNSTKPSKFRNKDIANLDASEYPLFTQRFNIPLTLPAIYDVVKCITDIAKEVPEVLELPKHGGYKGSGKLLFPLVPSTTEQGLYANAKKWLPGVVDAAIDEESQLATCHAVTIFVKVLAMIDPQAFQEICKTKYREEHQKIDPLLQKALVYDAKLAQNQLSLVKKYTIVALGYNMWQPLKKVQELDVEVFPVTPVPFIDNKRKRTAHYRSIDKLFKWKLDSVLRNTDAPLRFNGNSDIKKLAECHIILGGDHGQGAFRMVATLLLFSKGTTHKFNLEFEEDFLCGFIECKKDTYETLAKTIALPLDQSLQRIRDAKELVFCSDDDGKLSVYWGGAAAAQAGATITHTISVGLFKVGDLAYQLLVQGREGMSPHWCPRCMWGKQDWQRCCLECEGQAVLPTTGEPWTLELLDARLAMVNQIEEGGRKANAQERKGVTKPPLFTSIPIGNYISPLLHSVDLFLNSAKALLDAYIDYRLENRPIELLEARWEEADMKIMERQCKEDLDHAESLLEAAQELGDADLIEQAKEACVLKRAAHKGAKKEFGKVAAAARKLEKLRKYGAMSQALRQEVDQLLAEMFHILRSTYHGCDYEGNFCRKLMRLAIEAMDAIEALLHSVPRQGRAPGCSDEEITKYCGAFKQLFQYFDLLSHYGYQPYGSITDTEMDSIRNKLVPYMDRLWRKLSRNVPPKVHVWQHLLEDLERFRGLKHHQESKIEVAHQVGKDTDQRFRSLAGSMERKIKCAMKYQANLSDPKTKAKQAEVHAIRARKIGEKSKQAKQQKLEAAKRNKTSHIASILELPEIQDDFPSLLELTVIDRLDAATDG